MLYRVALGVSSGGSPDGAEDGGHARWGCAGSAVETAKRMHKSMYKGKEGNERRKRKKSRMRRAQVNSLIHASGSLGSLLE